MFQPDVNWLLNAAHCPANFTAKWVCDRLTYYQNVCEAGFGTPTRFFPELDIVTDEAKSFYWLGITPADTGGFARVEAKLSGDRLYVRADNAREVNIDLDRIAKQLRFSTYDVGGNTALTLTIVRGRKTVFTVKADDLTTGDLPENLFAK